MKLTLKHKIFIYLINLLHKTLRIKLVGELPSEPSLIVFWHSNMFPMWYLFRNKNANAVVSKSKDGEILSAILKKWSFILLRGSSNDGAKEVLQKVIDSSKIGFTLMTPDGPRGPKEIFKPGAVVAAWRGQIPLTYCNVSYYGRYIFKKSWDYFNLPLPFSKVKIEFSEMLMIPESSSRDEIDEIIENIQQKMRNK